jgi:hypothetical protein
MDPLLQAIRDNPRAYLPGPSLAALSCFCLGYSSRSSMEGQPHDWQYDRDEFHDWLATRFQLMSAQALAGTSIVASFAYGEADAFSSYFALLKEFLSLGPKRLRTPSETLDRKDFIEMMKSIRRRPAMYIGSASFLGCCSYLMGDERAYQDLGLSGDEGRDVFRSFQQWIENEKNRSGIHRPWFKVVQFWSGGVDCGENAGAYKLFLSWLDEYVKKVGRPGLFDI